MANQRHPRKVRIAVWLLPEEKRTLEKYAKATGTNMSEVIKSTIAQHKIKYGSKK